MLLHALRPEQSPRSLLALPRAAFPEDNRYLRIREVTFYLNEGPAHVRNSRWVDPPRISGDGA